MLKIKKISLLVNLIFSVLIVENVFGTSNENKDNILSPSSPKNTNNKRKGKEKEYTSEAPNSTSNIDDDKPSSESPAKKARLNINNSSTSGSSHPQASFKDEEKKHTNKFYSLFCKVMAKGPHILEFVPEQITVEDENAKGSRKWVENFPSTQSESEIEWHNQASRAINLIRSKNIAKNFLPRDTNFARASLTFILTNGQKEEIDLPFFFVSGWPANDNKNSIQKFVNDLSAGRLGNELKAYQKYGLRFITQLYEKDKCTLLYNRSYSPFKEKLKAIMNAGLDNEDRLVAEERLQAHINLLEDNENVLLAKLYFHCEQSIWSLVKQEIETFKNKYENRSKSDLCTYFKKPTDDFIHYVQLNICSFYDMCWCCGDTLTSCCHYEEVGAKVVVHASGCSPYFDTPFNYNWYALRDHRSEFPGFTGRKAYTIEKGENMSSTYKPYIAHAAIEDLK